MNPMVAVNPLPINLRIFDYGDDDLVIELVEAGGVTRFMLPEIRYKVDDHYGPILKMIYQSNAVGREISRALK